MEHVEVEIVNIVSRRTSGQETYVQIAIFIFLKGRKMTDFMIYCFVYMIIQSRL